MPRIWQTVAMKSRAEIGRSTTAATFLVGLADDLTALDAAAGQHRAPGARIVVAARLGAARVDLRRAAELAHPDRPAC